MLREVCHPGLCQRTVEDPEAALAAAAERLQKGPVRGPVVDRRGRVRTGTVREADLYAALAGSDVDPYAARRAAGRDRFARRRRRRTVPAPAVAASRRSTGINLARFLATSCVEARLPWAPDSPVAGRADALAAFVTERAASFAPFSPEVVASSSLTALCADWPPTPRPEAVPYAGPDVPVLVLAGRVDLRTPLEDARRTAAQYPNAQLLAVRDVGHSVLDSDVTRLRARRDGRVPGGRSVVPCPRAQSGVPSRRTRPPTLGALRPTALSGLAGRTLSAVTVTLTGIGFDVAASPPDGTTRYPGLRGGYVRGTGRSLQLVRAEWIRGVRISGRLDSNGRGTLTRDRPGARNDHLHARRRPRQARRARVHPRLTLDEPSRGSDPLEGLE